MRLPTDVTLLIGPNAPPELVEIWRAERLPSLSLPAPDGIESELDALRTATVVACGEGAREAAALAAKLGYRTFLVDDLPAPEGVHAATLAEAVQAGLLARSRERWKAARAAGGV